MAHDLRLRISELLSTNQKRLTTEARRHSLEQSGPKLCLRASVLKFFPHLLRAVADLVALRRHQAEAPAALLVREAEGVGFGVELARLRLVHARRAVVGLLPLARLRHDGQAVALDAVGAGDRVEER